jgi:hypothetical protein
MPEDSAIPHSLSTLTRTRTRRPEEIAAKRAKEAKAKAEETAKAKAAVAAKVEEAREGKRF